jgi:uncharacterized membrane protein YcfT
MTVSAGRTRIAWPDAARGLAITLVVLHHAIQFTGDAGLAVPAWDGLTEFLRTMRMPLFFMAAGLFAGKWTRAPWRDLFRSKILLFAWVFAIWEVIRWGAFNLIPRESEESGILNLVLHFFIWPVGGWFVLVLGIFFLVARLTVRVDRRIQLAVAAAISIVWFSGFTTGNRAWDGMLLFYVFFVFGCYWRDWVTIRAERLTWWAGAAIVGAWVAAAGVLGLLNLGDAPVLGFALRVLGLAAGIALALALQRLVWLRTLGTKTLPIYMVHPILIFAAVSGVLALGGAQWAEVGWWLPPAIGGIALLASFGIAIAAPRVHAEWLFHTPGWLTRLYDRATRPRRPDPVAETAETQAETRSPTR